MSLLGERFEPAQQFPASAAPSPSSRQFAGLFLIPTFFSLVQCWAAFRVILQVPAGSIEDGIGYVTHSRLFVQPPVLPLRQYFAYAREYGLYPLFLRLFDLGDVHEHWAEASTHPQIVPVYAAQALLLAFCTALFLSLAYRLIPGPPVKRAVLAALMGALLLSPFVVVWPSHVLTEAVTLAVLLMLVAACLAYDAERRYALILIGLVACLLVGVRDPMIFFVWIFALLLGVNAVCAWVRPRRLYFAAGLLLLIVAASVGYSRATVLGGRYLQTFANVIQLRILPDPQLQLYFGRRGLPLTPAVLNRAGQSAWADNNLFLPDQSADPEIVAYRDWIAREGIRTYGVFLLTHPGYLVRSLVASPNLGDEGCGADYHFSLIDLFSVPMNLYRVDATPYPPWLRNLLLVPLGWFIPLLYVVVVAVRYVRRTWRRVRAPAVEVVALASAASIFVSYHTDACDLWRHALPFILLIYLSLIVRVPEIAAAWSAARLSARPA
jgi:hypothetical protein